MKKPVKRGPGRPRKEDPISKDHIIPVALSAGGAEALSKFQDEEEIRSRSAAARQLIEEALTSRADEAARRRAVGRLIKAGRISEAEGAELLKTKRKA
jgi:hypothetical protein